MATLLTLDADVLSALLALVGTIKPIHDKFFAYAVAADNQELDDFVGYIRKRSHLKGTQWKTLIFFLNDFVTLTTIPGTPDYPVNVNQAVPDILSAMLDDECAIRQAVEDCIAQARAANENRAIQLLNDFVKDQAKGEKKIVKLQTLFAELNGDLYEWQKQI